MALVATFTATLLKEPEINTGFVKKTGKTWKCCKLSLLAVDETAQYFCVTLWGKDITPEIASLKVGTVIQGEGRIDIKAWTTGARGAVKSALYIIPSKPIKILKQGENDAIQS